MTLNPDHVTDPHYQRAREAGDMPPEPQAPPLRDRLCRLEDLAWQMRVGLNKIRDRLQSGADMPRDAVLRAIGDLIYNTGIDLVTETHDALRQYDKENR